MKKSNRFYYAREAKTIGLLTLVVIALLECIRYCSVIVNHLFSEKGMTVLLGLAIGGVAALAIRIYYRVIVIKYR